MKGGPREAADNTAMPQIELNSAARREYRAQAHHLNPVVMVGGDGLTPAVRKEIDAALNAHGLIKIRVFSDDRAAQLMYQALAAELNARPFSLLAKLFVLWRRNRKEPSVDETACPARAMKVLKYSKRRSAPRNQATACWATSA